MSTKSTIILTEDNEHWYNDCSEPLTKLTKIGEPYKDVITIEFDKNNIRVDLDDEDSLVISITNPNCDLYNIISKLKQLL